MKIAGQFILDFIMVHGIIQMMLKLYDMMKCKGICERFAVKRLRGSRYYYKNGKGLCSICEIFVSTDGSDRARCPCCNNKLRLSPRKKTVKQTDSNHSKKCSEFMLL